MATSMARLGTFTFGLDTAAFQDLQRQSTYRWQAKNRIGRKSAMQFTGIDTDTITMRGVIYPHFRGGLGQLERMRAMAGTGVPMPLIYTNTQVGQLLGNFCITSVGEGRTVFFDNGAPRKIEFDISIVEYGDDTVLGLTLPGASGVLSQTSSLAPSGALSDIEDRISSAVNTAQTVSAVAEAAGLGSSLGEIAGAVADGIQGTYDALVGSNTGKLLQAAVGQVKDIKATASSLKTAAAAVKAAGSDPLAIAQAVQGLGQAASLGSEKLGSAASGILAAGGLVAGSSAATLFSTQASTAAQSFSDFAGNLTTVEGMTKTVVGVILG